MTSPFDLDKPLDRTHTDSLKWDARRTVFGTEDVLPLWVADMDFATPPVVQQALLTRAAHPIYGYTRTPDSLVEALHGWFERRHHWSIEPAHVLWFPGTVPSIVAAILALTERGDGIIVPTPAYPPFFSAVERNARRLCVSPLVRENGRYVLDFESMETLAKEGAKMLLLCSPHNPVGRVWTHDELDRIVDIAMRYQLIVLSDEVHADFVYPGNTHTIFAHYAPDDLRVITALSPAKTFNIPGLALTAVVVSHADDRRRLQRVLEASHLSATHPFSMAAFEAAYTHGDAWFDALLAYLDDNRRWLHTQIQSIPSLYMDLPESTYLAWLDCSRLERSPGQLRKFFIKTARLGLNPGLNFGKDGALHMRMNFGTQRVILTEAIERLRAALNE